MDELEFFNAFVAIKMAHEKMILTNMDMRRIRSLTGLISYVTKLLKPRLTFVNNIRNPQIFFGLQAKHWIQERTLHPPFMELNINQKQQRVFIED